MLTGLRIYGLLLILMGLIALPSEGRPRPSRFIVYVGTYTGQKSKGIYAFRFDARSGQLTPIGLAARTENPSFLALHPSNRFLYAVNEVDEFAGKKNEGAASAFKIDPATGLLRLLNQLSTRGGSPCHLVVDATGRQLLVANYNGGSVVDFPITGDGSLLEAAAFVQHTGSSLNRERQQGPHAHGVYPDLTNRFAAVVDLGLDKVLVYRFDSRKGLLNANDPPSQSVKPGAGPRHFAFHPGGRFAYTNNELNSTVTCLRGTARTAR